MIFNPGVIITVVLALGALVALWQGDRALQRQKGASVAIEKVKDNNAKVVRKAADAGRKSRDDAAPGVLNPQYRD